MKYAVLDVETTGVYPGGHDRIVEVGIIGLDSTLAFETEFTTLVNPRRDMGPTWLHGIRAADVRDAPEFPEIAGAILELLEGLIVVGHNVTFDLRFLEAELARADVHIPRPAYVDTLPLALSMGSPTRRLSEACELVGVEVSDSHSALGDATATAKLFWRCVDHLGLEQVLGGVRNQGSADEPPWPRLPTTRPPLPRSRARAKRRAAEPYLATLIRELPLAEGEPHDWQDYYSVLDRALEDRRISPDEQTALSEAANDAGLSRKDLLAANRSYLRTLVAVALHDEVLTETEKADLEEVARLLMLETELEQLLQEAPPKAPSQETASEATNLAGRTVCFTGSLNASIGGERVSRAKATDLAAEYGLIPVKGVTKKLDILVMADPHSMSRKAKKARKYGTRIVAEQVFWHLLGVDTDG